MTSHEISNPLLHIHRSHKNCVKSCSGRILSSPESERPQMKFSIPHGTLMLFPEATVSALSFSKRFLCCCGSLAVNSSTTWGNSPKPAGRAGENFSTPEMSEGSLQSTPRRGVYRRFLMQTPMSTRVGQDFQSAAGNKVGPSAGRDLPV